MSRCAGQKLDGVALSAKARRELQELLASFGQLPESSRAVVQGEGIVVGLRRSLTTGELWVDAGEYLGPGAVAKLNLIAKEALGAKLPRNCSAMAINRNSVSVRHRDSKNLGESVIMSNDSYRDGEFCIEVPDGEDEAAVIEVDARSAAVVFDGRLAHYNFPSTANAYGEQDRWTIIIYDYDDDGELSKGCRKSLEALGFRPAPRLPFVENGLGAPSGLSPLEHVLWATQRSH